MRRMAILCLAAAMLGPLALAPAGAGCQRVTATGRKAFIPLGWEEEIALGREAAPELEKEFGGPLKNLAVQAYVRTVGERVARSARHPDMPALPYRFTVLDSDSVNAFALPGGPVYVTRGLLEHLATEGQLAAVLGHEVAHVNARHGGEQIGRQMGLQVLIAAAQIALDRGEGGADKARHAETLGKVIGSLVNLRYGRRMESEADHLGLDYMVAAGYHPREMVRLLKIFAEMGKRRPLEFLNTHPNPDNRLGAVEEQISEKYPNRGGRVAEKEYHREVINRLKTRK